MNKIVAVILACLTFWFAPVVQAESAAVPFDHNKTGFVLRDVHTTLRCEQCHVDGIFKNTPKDCAGCHAVGTRVNATPKPVNHVSTNSSCDTCHVSATTFQVKSFKHIGITNGCSSCHNGQSLGVVSKPASHFPTLLPCENCHTNTNTFTSWKMDHTGLTTGCASCHSGQFPGVVSGPPVLTAHIPTNGAPCESCHASTTTFLGAVYSHASVAPGTCITCHSGAMPGVTGKPASHIPTLGINTCDTCHANTNGFTTWLNGFYDHITPASTGTCLSCHNGSYTNWLAQGQNPGHIATLGAQCDTCHTSSNTLNFTTFLGAGYNHSAVVPGSCSNAGCHDGSAAGLGAGALGKSSFPTHIPTSAACDTCHTASVTQNYTTFLGALYDHTTISPSPAGRCNTCHNGTTATGKNVGHIPTTAQCDTCHKTQWGVSWLGALFHANNTTTPVAGVCGGSGCHDGSANGVAAGAQGKPVTHVPTTGINCDSCHTSSTTLNFSTWLGATYVHPASAAGICQTCHNGVSASGKSVPHIPTTGQTCDACHTTSLNQVALGYPTGWAGAGYSHTGVAAGSCATCHNGSYPGVTSQTSFSPFVHQVTSAPCDQCHTASNTANYTTWLGAGFAHGSSAPPGSCINSGCHGPGGAGKGVTSNHVPVAGMSCDSGGCHAVFGGSVTTFAGGNLVHSLFAASRCDSCHNGAYTTFGTTGAIVKVSNHIPTTIVAAADCNTCHSKVAPPATAAAATGGATLWANSEKMNHNGAQGGGAPVYCVTCHLSGTTYLGTMQKKSHNGASTAKDCSSSSCHKPIGKTGSTYSNWN
jgi:hypothetical protein